MSLVWFFWLVGFLLASGWAGVGGRRGEVSIYAAPSERRGSKVGL